MSFKLTVGRTSILDIDAVHNEAIISIYPYVDTENYLETICSTFSRLSPNGEIVKMLLRENLE